MPRKLRLQYPGAIYHLMNRGDRRLRSELRQADGAHAEGVLGTELRRRRWTEADLDQRRKGDKEKVKIAVRLRGSISIFRQPWAAKIGKRGP